MSSNQLLKFVLPIVATGVIGSFAVQSAETPLTAKELREVLVGLGYEVKDLSTEAGKEKYEILTKTDSFNVPMGAEISPSKSYIWLTVYLGADADTRKHRDILKQNGLVQPSQFYVTKSDKLMVALPVENRGMTPAYLKDKISKLVGDVESSATVWQAGSPPPSK